LKILTVARFNLVLKKGKEESSKMARRKSTIFDGKIPLDKLMHADE